MMKLEMSCSEITVLMLLAKEQWWGTTSVVWHEMNCKEYKESFADFLGALI
jgi:hypothetical protein